jgi:GGDEF domain-containing protein
VQQEQPEGVSKLLIGVSTAQGVAAKERSTSTTSTCQPTASASCGRRQPEPGAASKARKDDESGEALFRAADAALYLAKEAGRNHVFVA